MQKGRFRGAGDGDVVEGRPGRGISFGGMRLTAALAAGGSMVHGRGAFCCCRVRAKPARQKRGAARALARRAAGFRFRGHRAAVPVSPLASFGLDVANGVSELDTWLRCADLHRAERSFTVIVIDRD